MCGILAKFNRSKQIDEADFEAQLDSIRHRGPDDKGIRTFEDGKIALGHTRLSFLDLSNSGKQPLSKAGLHIIFNGEIYNHNDLREEFKKKGAHFKSGTDTEVILEGYRLFGLGVFDKLNGMFAVVIYDASNKEIILARDKYGIKPLYISNNNDSLTLASELKVFQSDGGISKKARFYFLLLGFVPEPTTIYPEVEMFPSGMATKVCSEKLITIDSKEITYEHTIKESETLKESFVNAIELQLSADVPIGVFLSGGLDSSALVSLAKKDVQTVSIYFDDEDYSEKKFQKLISDKYSLKHYELLLTKSYFRENIDDFLKSMDSPTIDGFNTYIVSKLAHESGLKSCLSGVGSDELLYGYPSFKRDKLLNVLCKVPGPIIDILSKFERTKRLTFLKLKNKALGKYLVNRSLFLPEEIKELLQLDDKTIQSYIEDLERVYEVPQDYSSLQKVSELETSLYMKNQLLRDADVFSMANKLEIRVPFLDYNFSRIVSGTSDSQKESKAYNKPILVEFVKELIDDSIYNRNKSGFEIPYREWLSDELEHEYIPESIRNGFKGGTIHWSKVWALVVLNKFDNR
ncbi:asparagine synthase (glutamine-hydrolyzing) [Vibrio coralliilyticus]|uniref:asparagine synthase (glutamine-hydrolyzing) n=1 Tax=Vibrio coralliilyticus TaxID=190893 RepID=UPI003917401A